MVDAQLPPALARMLTSLGHIAEHVADIGLRDADDTPIWSYAMQHHAAILTKDEDFARRIQQGGAGPVIIWLRIGNTNRRSLLQWFEPLLAQVLQHIEQGDHLIEVR